MSSLSKRLYIGSWLVIAGLWTWNLRDPKLGEALVGLLMLGLFALGIWIVVTSCASVWREFKVTERLFHNSFIQALRTITAWLAHQAFEVGLFALLGFVMLTIIFAFQVEFVDAIQLAAVVTAWVVLALLGLIIFPIGPIALVVAAIIRRSESKGR